MNSFPEDPPAPAKSIPMQDFELKLEKLIQDIEQIRVRYMTQYQNRSMTSTTGSILLTLVCAGGFAWFFLYKAQPLLSLPFAILCFVLPFVLHVWAQKPLLAYKHAYKSSFLPKLANLLGGFKFHPQRGISAKIINKTGIIPKHELYQAEDCFMGKHKSVKVIFSEARLYRDSKPVDPLFRGIFVLLEAPDAKFDGHTILSADYDMVQSYARTRWKKLEATAITSENEYANLFRMYSTNPEAAQSIANDSLLKELGEASDIFGKAPLTAVFFQKKYIFMMIPYLHDMFEPSNIHLPVQNHQHAIQCKKEIDQIMEVIDVFDLYQQDDIKEQFEHSTTEL